MRRGTIGLLGPKPSPLLPTFRFAATQQPQIVRVLLRDLHANGFAVDEGLLNSEFDIYQGDLVTIGRGEVMMRHDAN
jgi:hypothetical protein